MITDKGNVENLQPDDLLKYRIECRLVEYKTWNEFLHSNWQQRFILVGLNMTSLGTLLSLAIVGNSPSFLLVAGFISAVLGLVWTSLARWAVTIMGILLDDCIEKLRELIKDNELFLTDSTVRETGTDGAKAQKFIEHIKEIRSPDAVIGIFVFFFPSLALLLIGFISILTRLSGFYTEEIILNSLLAFVCLVLLILLGFSGYKLITEWRLHRHANSC